MLVILVMLSIALISKGAHFPALVNSCQWPKLGGWIWASITYHYTQGSCVTVSSFLLSSLLFSLLAVFSSESLLYGSLNSLSITHTSCCSRRLMVCLLHQTVS